MRRSLRETFELIVFSLIAVLIGVLVLWLLGKVLGLVGFVMVWLAELLWLLLRFVLYVAIPAVIIYALIRVVQRSSERVAVPSVAAVEVTEDSASKTMANSDAAANFPAHDVDTEFDTEAAHNEVVTASKPVDARETSAEIKDSADTPEVKHDATDQQAENADEEDKV